MAEGKAHIVRCSLKEVGCGERTISEANLWSGEQKSHMRFIFVNDNYDSAELADGTTGGLDGAFKNLIYDYYSREMSKKQKIAWERMAEKGQYNATCALYGYRKSKEDKHKLVIEPEEAAVVREIFDMKIAGIGTMHIAKSLNDRGILSPAELYRSRGDKRKWNRSGETCYWTACKVVSIIQDEKYTGIMVFLKTKLESVGGKQIRRPREEWVRVGHTHEAIVSYSQYIKAVSSLKQQKVENKKIFTTADAVGGQCIMHITERCFAGRGHSKQIPSCKDVAICKHEADMVVLAAVRKEAQLFLDRDKLSKQVIKRNVLLSVSEKINATTKSIETAQRGWIALYDKYAGEKLEREFFINEKKQYNADMERMEEELAALRQAQEKEKAVQEGSERKVCQAMTFLEEEELTEDIKEKLIEKVVIYPNERMEHSCNSEIMPIE